MVMAKSFGAAPRTKVLVRIIQVMDGKFVSTQSFAVHGQTVQGVTDLVESTLEHHYGGHGAEETEDEEDVPAPAKKKLSIKKRR